MKKFLNSSNNMTAGYKNTINFSTSNHLREVVMSKKIMVGKSIRIDGMHSYLKPIEILESMLLEFMGQ